LLRRAPNPSATGSVAGTVFGPESSSELGLRSGSLDVNSWGCTSIVHETCYRRVEEAVSHVIPKFVGDWLRDTGVTRRLRGSEAPNKLVEDLEWRHMLCESCEAR